MSERIRFIDVNLRREVRQLMMMMFFLQVQQQDVVSRGQRCTGAFTRWLYELFICTMVVLSK
ncbi:hypothetical protein LDENG_00224190 [Lucifuga dentata]|nr:hypothetical protein LDENG_00224190 [Lucifuga dentata]